MTTRSADGRVSRVVEGVCCWLSQQVVLAKAPVAKFRREGEGGWRCGVDAPRTTFSWQALVAPKNDTVLVLRTPLL